MLDMILKVLFDNIDLILNVTDVMLDFVIVIITVITLHLTVFSTDVRIINSITKYDKFHGISFSFVIKNNTLHSICISGIVVVKKVGEEYKYIKLSEYKDPIIIDSWHIKKVNTKPISAIDKTDTVDEVLKCSVVGINSGDAVIWPKKWDYHVPKHILNKTYKERYKNSLTVTRNQINDQYVSNNINFAITYIDQDINANNIKKTALMIVNYDGGLLSEQIQGKQVIAKQYCQSSRILQEYLNKLCGDNIVDVDVVKNGHVVN